MFSEKGGQERDRLDCTDFFYFVPPTFEFAHPAFSDLGRQTRIVAHPNY